MTLPLGIVETALKRIEQIQPVNITYYRQLFEPVFNIQTCEALAQQALTLVEHQPMNRLGSLGYEIQKPVTAHIRATLCVIYPTGTYTPWEGFPQTIRLEIKTESNYILEFEFPTRDPGYCWERNTYRYADFSTFPRRLSYLYDLENEEASIKDMQHYWCGLRFLCRNLRDWEQPGIIWPEQV